MKNLVMSPGQQFLKLNRGVLNLGRVAFRTSFVGEAYIGFFKGGVGKTRVVILLANCLGMVGLRVLVIDLDFNNFTTFYYLTQDQQNLGVSFLNYAGGGEILIRTMLEPPSV